MLLYLGNLAPPTMQREWRVQTVQSKTLVLEFLLWKRFYYIELAHSGQYFPSIPSENRTPTLSNILLTSIVLMPLMLLLAKYFPTVPLTTKTQVQKIYFFLVSYFFKKKLLQQADILSESTMKILISNRNNIVQSQQDND